MTEPNPHKLLIVDTDKSVFTAFEDLLKEKSIECQFAKTAEHQTMFGKQLCIENGLETKDYVPKTVWEKGLVTKTVCKNSWAPKTVWKKDEL